MGKIKWGAGSPYISRLIWVLLCEVFFVLLRTVKISRTKNRSATRVAIIYIILGGLWIILSDNVLHMISPDLKYYATLQTYKGWFFVLASGLIIFLLIRAELRKREKIEQELVDNLEEKKVLIQEIHHRVKNNLNSIIGLLDLQMLKSDNPDLREGLTISKNRIFSMALIHEQLYQTEKMETINFREFMPRLIGYIRQIDEEKTNSIAIEYDIENCIIAITSAVPCAMIVNEMITNSLKHAFPNGRKGRINLEMKSFSQVIWLSVRDDGIGVPPGWSLDSEKGLGLELIKILTHQLKGTINVKHDKGLHYELTFPIVA